MGRTTAPRILRARSPRPSAVLTAEDVRVYLPGPRPRASPTQSSDVDLVIEALEICAAAHRRLMRQTGFTKTEIETASKRNLRLRQRLEAGQRVPERDVEFIVEALMIAAALHRMVSRRRGGRDSYDAATFEHAAKVISRVRRVRAPEQKVPTVPTQREDDGVWEQGTRLVERTTGAVWWVDELDAERPDLVGLIPDEGAATVRWMRRDVFVRRTPPPSKTFG